MLTALKVAARYQQASYFQEGDLILFGKFRNKPAKVVRLFQDDRGIPYVEVQPVPQGRKKNRVFGLYTIRKMSPEDIAKVQTKLARDFGDRETGIWPKWLLKADTENADVTVSPDGTVVWHGGTWKGGIWKDGIWKGGVWKNGVWEDGTWQDGVWQDGIWEHGTWGGGVWRKGTWQDGIWNDGDWKNGVWENGTWEDGEWEDGTWEDGEWLNGRWKDGTWRYGDWMNGTWQDGVWEDGTWERGQGKPSGA